MYIFLFFIVCQVRGRYIKERIASSSLVIYDFRGAIVTPKPAFVINGHVYVFVHYLLAIVPGRTYYNPVPIYSHLFIYLFI